MGSDKDLFARAAAEIVTEPALIEEPLAAPGKVIRRLRGTAAEQMAALPPDKPRWATRLRLLFHGRSCQVSPSPIPGSAGEGGGGAGRYIPAASCANPTRGAGGGIRQRTQAVAVDQKKEKDRLTGERDNAAKAYDRVIHDWRDR